MIITKDQLLDTLSAHGVVNVIVCYDGQGDSGMIEDVKISPADGPLSAPVKTGVNEHHWNGSGYEPQDIYANTIQELIETFVYDKLEHNAPGWEIDDGSYGHIEIDVAERSVSWEHYNRFTSSEYVDIGI